MRKILDDDIRKLIQEITPWIIGSKGSEDDFAPIFKEDTPIEIIEKHEKLKFLIKSREF